MASKREAGQRQLLTFLLAVFCLALAAATTEGAASPAAQTLAATASARYQFGKSITFELQAEGPAERQIEEATLFVRLDRSPSAVAIPVAIRAGRVLEAQHELDLVAEPLAPFSTVTYWWALRDDAGQRYSVAQQTLEYVDDRFAWESLEEGPLHVYWTGQPEAVAQAAMDQAQAATERLKRVYPVNEDVPVAVYVYPTLDDLQSALRLTGRDFVGAHVYPETDALLVWSNNPLTAAAELGQSVAHEMSHLLLYRQVGDDYWRVPRWFDEGVATHFEASPRPEDETLLRDAARSGGLLPLYSLCQAFPDQPNRLAYAQSASLIDFIEREFGTSALNAMAQAAADGADCQTMTTRALGIELDELERRWRQEYAPGTLAEISTRRLVWIVLVAGGFVIMFLLIQFRTGGDRATARQS